MGWHTRSLAFRRRDQNAPVDVQSICSDHVRRPKLLRVGFVPLTDCAPLVVAKELGFFSKYDLKVSLSREIGWATIRDKIAFGELDAAHALAGLPFATVSLPGYEARRCVTGVVLSLNGDAITLSNKLWNAGVRDGATLRRHLKHQRRARRAVLGVPSLYSSHHFLLRQWLANAEIDIDREVNIATLPPQQLAEQLRAGNLDGYCVGEPWNSVAISQGSGWCAATSSEIFPLHPEKVLLVSEQFEERHHEEHLRMIAALVEACDYCDRPENHDTVVGLLAQRQYVNVPAETLKNGFTGSFNYGHGRTGESPDFAIFSRYDANVPSHDKASWLTRQMTRSGVMPTGATTIPTALRAVFRPDLFEQARELISPDLLPSR
jgi:ABC-type nitrate/sulfonate/bicarbonate transport system substrate-binding protein